MGLRIDTAKVRWRPVTARHTRVAKLSDGSTQRRWWFVCECGAKGPEVVSPEAADRGLARHRRGPSCDR